MSQSSISAAVLQQGSERGIARKLLAMKRVDGVSLFKIRIEIHKMFKFMESTRKKKYVRGFHTLQYTLLYCHLYFISVCLYEYHNVHAFYRCAEKKKPMTTATMTEKRATERERQRIVFDGSRNNSINFKCKINGNTQVLFRGFV